MISTVSQQVDNQTVGDEKSPGRQAQLFPIKVYQTLLFQKARTLCKGSGIKRKLLPERGKRYPFAQPQPQGSVRTKNGSVNTGPFLKELIVHLQLAHN